MLETRRAHVNRSPLTLVERALLELIVNRSECRARLYDEMPPMLLTLFKSFLRGNRGDPQTAADVRLHEFQRPLGARLKNAAKLHRDGDLAGARVLYEEVLKAQPENVDAHHLLGLLDLYCGNYQSAEASMRRAIEVYGGNASGFRTPRIGPGISRQPRGGHHMLCAGSRL